MRLIKSAYRKSERASKLERAGKALLSLIFVSALGACSGLLFFPQREHLQTPDNLGLEYRDIELSAADGTQLHAWLLPSVGTPKGSILFLHGNAENISTHIHNVRWLPAAGYQVLLLDYRGFGLSKGKAKLPEVFFDIDAAITWLSEAPETANQDLFILGQSIGASLMLHGATRHLNNPKLCGLVSDAAFTRYRTMVRHVAKQSWLTWPLQYPVSWSVPGAYDPLDALPQLNTLPILFFHSRNDQIIPFANLDTLVAAHSGPHQRVASQGRHTATFNQNNQYKNNQNENRQTLLDFLAENTCSATQLKPL